LEKLLDGGAWTRLASSVAPGLIIVVSIILLLGVERHIGNSAVSQWCAGLGIVLAAVVASSLIEELSGRVEARLVDGYGYPVLRTMGLRRLKRIFRMVSVRRIYLSRYGKVWESYLDVIPPKERSIRWAYYESLVQRHKISIALGTSSFVSGLIWLAAPLLAKLLNVRHEFITATVQNWIAYCLLFLAAYLLLYESSSSAAILHFHRIRLLRARRMGPADARS
jgi:hypothetical protein